jgi:aspartate oxidase
MQMEALENIAEKEPKRVTIIKKAQVTKLLQDGEGKVTGVEYVHKKETRSASGPVILATGG